MTIDALVLHSGGMDSSICLLLAALKFGRDRVISVGFRYHQRHSSELEAASSIAAHYGIRREVIDLPRLPGWERSSLINGALAIDAIQSIPNTFVPARNGLFLMMAAPFAQSAGAKVLYIGVIEREGAFSGYPDCHRSYIDAVQAVIRLDLSDPSFSVQTPLIQMSKAETLEVANSLGALEYLLDQTVSCYNGLPRMGCGTCPACHLRKQGIEEFRSRDL